LGEKNRIETEERIGNRRRRARMEGVRSIDDILEELLQAEKDVEEASQQQGG
tara:strand:+ start:887 stop:1042 length:156 start_codon:yes stop_codon:yes gene_type:complete